MPYNIQVTASGGVNYRTKPSTSSGKKMGAYPKGTKLYCNTKTKTGDETWYQVASNGYWVCGYQPKGGWYIKGLDGTSNKTDTTTSVATSTNKNNASNASTYSSGAFNASNISYTYEGSAVGVNVTSGGTNVAETFNKVTTPSTEQQDYKIDTSWVNQYVNIIKRNHNIYVDGDENLMNSQFEKFNRYRMEFPDLVLDKTFAHVFITRPDLNLFATSSKTSALHSQVENDPECYYLYKTRPEILTCLSKNHSANHDFNPFLSNRAASFEVSDEFIKTAEMGETLTGYKLSFGKNIIDSRTAGSFSIQYQDDKELNVLRMHKIWVEYISKVYRGEWSPKQSYMIDKILDYPVSVYYILTAGDGETILFWSKYYGAYPTNIPSSVLSYSKGNMVQNPEYSITYQYSFKEDFNPLALAEFNMNSKNGGFVYSKIYEPSLLSTGKTFSGSPFIDTVNNNGEYCYKLRFRKI